MKKYELMKVDNLWCAKCFINIIKVTTREVQKNFGALTTLLIPEVGKAIQELKIKIVQEEQCYYCNKKKIIKVD